MNLLTLLILWPPLALTIGLLIAPWFKRKCAGQSIEDTRGRQPDPDAFAVPVSFSFHATGVVE